MQHDCSKEHTYQCSYHSTDEQAVQNAATAAKPSDVAEAPADARIAAEAAAAARDADERGPAVGRNAAGNGGAAPNAAHGVYPRKTTKQPERLLQEFALEQGTSIKRAKAQSKQPRPSYSNAEYRQKLQQAIINAEFPWEEEWEVRSTRRQEGGTDAYFKLRGIELSSIPQVLRHLSGLAADQINPLSKQNKGPEDLFDPADFQPRGQWMRKRKNVPVAAPDQNHVSVRSGQLLGMLDLRTSKVQCRCESCAALPLGDRWLHGQEFRRHSGFAEGTNWRKSVKVTQGTCAGQTEPCVLEWAREKGVELINIRRCSQPNAGGNKRPASTLSGARPTRPHRMHAQTRPCQPEEGQPASGTLVAWEHHDP
ncbi:hypothetical protein WJX74_008978 [Apatococcus lobatus]|uniref:Uncharacterized protein n=2 Tax=Apatococcus TaxID=904362 RepID=A0AAW1T853_9CHLO